MIQYLNLLQHIIDNGIKRPDRTNTGTISVFGTQHRYDLNKGFPIITTKKIYIKSVVSELLWFIEGSSDELRLREIHHGDRNTTKTTIWTANANAEYWKSKAKFNGDLGRIYGVNWRSWRTGIFNKLNELIGIKYIDQLTELITGIISNPYSRRHILTAWNVGELDQMALPPCHILAQFYVANNRLSCQLYQR
jgi:thymidylate synthase